MIELATTASGTVAGTSGSQPGVSAFKGIPYAGSTEGPYRWRPPRPVEAWHGIREAFEFGPVAPQLEDTHGLTMNEDCLNLNVWTAAQSDDERRPVYVWMHGGRFSFGSGAEPAYDGSALADKGVIVVTVNVRLGVFGYLATPELTSETGEGGSGNWGLLDAVAALRWVRTNIAAFGGDPDQVTVGGHSSGGATTMALVYSPLASGLLHQVIIESATTYPKDPAISTLAPSHRDLPQAERDGVEFQRLKGVDSIEEMRALPMLDLLRASDGDDASVAGSPPPPLFRPVVDGWVLPSSYWDILSNGRLNDVAVLTGNNLDESGANPSRKISLATFRDFATARFGQFADEFLTLYPASSDEEAAAQLNASYREATRLSTWMWACEHEKHSSLPVFTYYWDHRPPGPAGDTRGAFHGSEMTYFFGNLAAEDLPYVDEDHSIADRMSSYVANFVRGGDPNGEGLPEWLSVESADARTFEVGDVFQSLRLADAAKVDFFNRFFDTQKAW